MRAEALRRLTPEIEWEWLDTGAPVRASSRLWRSVAFRYQRGAAVARVNRALVAALGVLERDLVWVDKGVFLYPRTVSRARRLARRLVHYTPDTAFHANRSRHFDASLHLYDLAVTTKSFELAEYDRRNPRRTLLVTQGFDRPVHYPRVADPDRLRAVVFVGLAERDRERCLAAMLSRKIPVILGGHGWRRFASEWRRSSMLSFVGEELGAEDYARTISSCWIGLGLLSRKFPELHTTRTFEIPACGTVLATEANAETRRFFSDSEALFFNDYDELADTIGKLFSASDVAVLHQTAAAGMRRVTADARDNDSILASILRDPRLS